MAGSLIFEWGWLSFLFVIEWTLAILLVAVIKNLVSNPEMHYPYPIFATFIMNTGTAILATLVAQFRRATFYVSSARSVSLSSTQVSKAWFRGFFNLTPRIGLDEYLRGLFPIGIFMGIEVGLSNTALKMLPVSLKTMIHACNPAMVVMCAWVAGLEKLTWQIQVVLLLVVGGGLTSARSDMSVGNVSLLGLALAVAALALQGFRFCFTQVVLTKGPGLGLKDDDRQDVVSRLTHVRGMRREALLKTEGGWHANGGAEKTMGRAATMPIEVVRAQAPAEALEAGQCMQRANTMHAVPLDVQVFVKSRVGSKAAHVSKIEVMSLTNPAVALVCLALAAVFEPGAFQTPVVGWGVVLFNSLGCSVFVLLKMGLDLMLIQRTSAFIFSLAGVVHNLLIILSGVVLFGEQNSPVAWLGFAMISAGVIFYAWNKAKGHSRGGGH